MNRPARSTALPVAIGVYVAIAMAGFACAAAFKGPWLDEFWSLWLSDPAMPFRRALHERWLPDPHPVFFNAALYTVRSVLPDHLFLLRSTMSGAALAAMGSGVAILAARAPRDRAFYAILVVTILALPYTTREFADLRSYIYQLATVTVWVAFVHHAAMREPDERLARSALLVGAIAAFGMIVTHYFAGIQASVLYVGSIVLFFRRDRRVLLWTAPAALAAWACLLVSAWIQSPEWARNMDVKWIDTGLLGALHILTTVGLSVLLSNPVASIACIATVRTTDARTVRFQRAMAAILVAASIAALAVNLIRPLVVDRYFAPLYPIIAGIVAAGALPWWRRYRAVPWLMLAAATLALVWNVWTTARTTGWDLGAATVARHVRDCPQTRVFGVSAWTLGKDAGSQTAQREWTVFDLGYRIEAKRFGFDVDVLPPVPAPLSRPLVLAPCPALIWADHVSPPVAAIDAVRKSRLLASPGDAVQIRRLPDANTLIEIRAR